MSIEAIYAEEASKISNAGKLSGLKTKQHLIDTGNVVNISDNEFIICVNNALKKRVKNTSQAGIWLGIVSFFLMFEVPIIGLGLFLFGGALYSAPYKFWPHKAVEELILQWVGEGRIYKGKAQNTQPQDYGEEFLAESAEGAGEFAFDESAFNGAQQSSARQQPYEQPRPSRSAEVDLSPLRLTRQASSRRDTGDRSGRRDTQFDDQGRVIRPTDDYRRYLIDTKTALPKQRTTQDGRAASDAQPDAPRRPKPLLPQPKAATAASRQPTRKTDLQSASATKARPGGNDKLDEILRAMDWADLDEKAQKSAPKNGHSTSRDHAASGQKQSTPHRKKPDAGNSSRSSNTVRDDDLQDIIGRTTRKAFKEAWQQHQSESSSEKGNTASRGQRASGQQRSTSDRIREAEFSLDPLEKRIRDMQAMANDEGASETERQFASNWLEKNCPQSQRNSSRLTDRRKIDKRIF